MAKINDELFFKNSSEQEQQVYLAVKNALDKYKQQLKLRLKNLEDEKEKQVKFLGKIQSKKDAQDLCNKTAEIHLISAILSLEFDVCKIINKQSPSLDNWVRLLVNLIETYNKIKKIKDDLCDKLKIEARSAFIYDTARDIRLNIAAKNLPKDLGLPLNIFKEFYPCFDISNNNEYKNKLSEDTKNDTEQTELVKESQGIDFQLLQTYLESQNKNTAEVYLDNVLDLDNFYQAYQLLNNILHEAANKNNKLITDFVMQYVINQIQLEEENNNNNNDNNYSIDGRRTIKMALLLLKLAKHHGSTDLIEDTVLSVLKFNNVLIESEETLSDFHILFDYILLNKNNLSNQEIDSMPKRNQDEERQDNTNDSKFYSANKKANVTMFSDNNINNKNNDKRNDFYLSFLEIK